MSKEKRINRLLNASEENDIKFHPVLSYRHLRIIAWAFLIISQLGLMLSTGSSLFNPGEGWETFFRVLQSGQSIMSPLFLLAAFTVVLTAKDGYRRLFILYGGLTVLVYVAFLFVYLHYFVGFLNIAYGYEGANELVKKLLLAFSPNGYFSFNIFVDLLLCTAVTFFLNYTPKDHFKGNKLYIFRFLALIPILYEVGSIVLKTLSGLGVMTLSPYVFPALTTKPPVAFFIFVFMAIFVKEREKLFVKKGKTKQDFKNFENTNLNRLHFSLFLTFIIVLAVILDIILLIGLPFLGLIGVGDAAPEVVEGIYTLTLTRVYEIGIGKTIPMLLIIPLVIFYDYKKTYKDNRIDMIIPVVGIALLVFVTIEGGYLITRGKLAELLKNISEETTEEMTTQ